MKKGAYRFCAGFLAMILLSVAVVPCYAVTDEYTSTGTFWSSLKEKWWLGFGSKFLIGQLADSACSESPDSRHHGSLKTYDQNPDGSYTAICNYCSSEFSVYDADLSAAYDDYVATLPAPSYTSSGGFFWQPTVSDIEYPFQIRAVSGNTSYITVEELPYKCFFGDAYYLVSSNADGTGFNYIVSGNLSRFVVSFPAINSKLSFIAPVSGSYRYDKAICSYNILLESGTRLTDTVTANGRGFFHSDSGEGVDFNPGWADFVSGAHVSYGTATLPFPTFEVIPDTALSGDTYNINTRPTSITGGNYGIVGDNGQITKVEDNSTIINETNNTYYNPATGQTVPITGWTYDYSDRSYKVTMEGGKTSTVTYGDENISITETTVNESGDTITNNYTIYYLVDGSENPSCEHDWQESSSTDPTCTLPGKVTLSCTKCQQTKTETLPALGHDWQVKQTVTTQYDDTGQLTQEGYTIFECSRCHEQYKSPDGTIPPGGGSGTDPGGEEGETIWDKIGKLLGTAVKGLLDLLGAAVDTVLGGLIDFIINLVESLEQLVDLFGSVGEAFQVLWTWLPPEITAILVAGVSIFVFVALLKFFMK